MARETTTPLLDRVRDIPLDPDTRAAVRDDLDRADDLSLALADPCRGRVNGAHDPARS